VKEVLHRLPRQLERHTRNTIADRDEFLAELDRVRAEGVAYDREEHTIGICAVGVALREPAGTLIAVTIPLPSQRFYGNEAKLAAALRDTCGEIEQALRSS
jgi:DNA-binding IclR family transcriptional regulator